jgi:hypothetical protein
LLLASGDEVSVAHGQAPLIQLFWHAEATYSARKTMQVLALQDREMETLAALVGLASLALTRILVGSSAPSPIFHRLSKFFTNYGKAEKHSKRSTKSWKPISNASWQQ